MVYYSIDTDANLRIYFIIALISTMISSSLLFLERFTACKLLAPSALFFCGKLIKVFDLYLWKLPIINKFACIPNLNDTGQGFFLRAEEYGDEQVKVEVILHITQTWSKIAISSETPKTTSEIRTISISIENANEIKLQYIYIVKNRTGLKPKSLYEEGFTELTLVKFENRLILKDHIIAIDSGKHILNFGWLISKKLFMRFSNN